MAEGRLFWMLHGAQAQLSDRIFPPRLRVLGNRVYCIREIFRALPCKTLHGSNRKAEFARSMPKKVSRSNSIEENETRVLLRLYLAEARTSEPQFLKEAGIAWDPSSFNRWLNGQTESSEKVGLVESRLRLLGYHPLHSRGMLARLTSRFFHTTANEQCDAFLSEREGHYTCYQMSSWFKGAVTVSHLEIEKADGDPLSRKLRERQHTGPKASREALAKASGSAVPDQTEGFEGCCFYTMGALTMLLRSKDKFVKTAICNEFDTDGIDMSGRVLKQSRRRTANYLHTTNLCLVRSNSPAEIVPRITSVDTIDGLIRERLEANITPL